MKKRKIVIGAALVLIVALIAGVTLAAFSGEAHVTNIITTGTISITLNEQVKDGATITKDKDGNITGAGITGMMPGVSEKKIVTVTNGGTGDSWVRANVSVRVVAADGKTALDARKVSIDAPADSKWFAADGNYYYSQPLAPKATTSQLMKSVTLDKNVGNDYQGCTIYVDITAQAVQVKNNNTVENTDGTAAAITELNSTNYTSVLGWPAWTSTQTN